jgi:putative addiction module component
MSLIGPRSSKSIARNYHGTFWSLIVFAERTANPRPEWRGPCPARAVTREAAGLSRLFGGVAERTIPGMTKAAKAVLADALRLREEERAELAAEVLASLDGPADPDAEAAWETEVRRRIDAIDAGAMDFEPWDAVKQRIEKEILGR